MPAEYIGHARHSHQHRRQHEVVALATPVQQGSISGFIDGKATRRHQEKP